MKNQNKKTSIPSTQLESAPYRCNRKNLELDMDIFDRSLKQQQQQQNQKKNKNES